VADDDNNHIRLSPAIFFMLIGASGLGGAGTFGALTPARDHNELAALAKSIEEIRTTANAAISLASRNERGVDDNRDLVYASTRDRFTAAEADKEFRARDARFEQVERRLAMIERILDAQ
jgi:hypothetical protein